MKKIITTPFLLFILIPAIFSQTGFDKAKLDSYFSALETNNKFMGSVAVCKNGELIYSKAVGFSDVATHRKADTHSKYKIGSITKSFTTVLVLKAVEEKKLELSQTIEKWFPTIKNAGEITIQQMLSHRSGIHNFTDSTDYLTWNTQPKTEQEMVDIITQGGSDFKPDSKAKYSNSNFVLLSYILEKTYNRSYTDLLKAKIIEPLGLTDTYVYGKIDITKNECQSYTFGEEWTIQPETDASIPLGAGAIMTTPTDLTTFANALFGGKLLKTESLAIMQTIKDGHGSGLFQIPFYESIGYGHGGGIDGFSSLYVYFPNEKIAYALISNGVNYNFNNVSLAVLSAVNGKSYELPTFGNFQVAEDDLNAYAGVYSSSQIGLKITINKNNGRLTAQATGQPSFLLDAVEKNIFRFDQAGVVMEFYPQKNTMTLKQGGAEFLFTKE